MNVYQKYKDAQGRKTGPWFIKYPIGRDHLTGKIRYKIEKVGEFKKLAERAYQKKMVEWAERKYLDIKEESKLTFSQLVQWFLELPVVRQNKTIKHIERACRDLEKVFGPVLVREIKPAMVEKYQHQRLQEPTWYGKPRSQANVNRTIAVMKRMFNLAIREELAEKNPCWKVKMLPENNARDRILSPWELERLLIHLPRHAAMIVHFAYLTGMRAGEIFQLSWDKVDLTNRVIRLEAKDTKTAEPRVVFLCDQAYDILREVGKVRFLEHNRVFTYMGKPLNKIKKALPNACRKAEIADFRFHDLRHTFNTNMRKAGVDQSVIMKLTGHKTPSMFQRYNTVDLDDAKNAYQKLEALLEQEPGRDLALAGKCSHSAPVG
jgi:integrase